MSSPSPFCDSPPPPNSFFSRDEFLNCEYPSIEEITAYAKHPFMAKLSCDILEPMNHYLSCIRAEFCPPEESKVPWKKRAMRVRIRDYLDHAERLSDMVIEYHELAEGHRIPVPRVSCLREVMCAESVYGFQGDEDMILRSILRGKLASLHRYSNKLRERAYNQIYWSAGRAKSGTRDGSRAYSRKSSGSEDGEMTENFIRASPHFLLGHVVLSPQVRLIRFALGRHRSFTSLGTPVFRGFDYRDRRIPGFQICSSPLRDRASLSASALGQLGETAFGNPSRDFTLRKAGYSYPSRWVEEPGCWLYEGVFGGPSSGKDRHNTTLEGAEGGEKFGKKGERGAVWWLWANGITTLTGPQEGGDFHLGSLHWVVDETHIGSLFSSQSGSSHPLAAPLGPPAKIDFQGVLGIVFAGSVLQQHHHRSIMGAAHSAAGKNQHLELFLRRQKAGPPPGCRRKWIFWADHGSFLLAPCCSSSFTGPSWVPRIARPEKISIWSCFCAAKKLVHRLAAGENGFLGRSTNRFCWIHAGAAALQRGRKKCAFGAVFAPPKSWSTAWLPVKMDFWGGPQIDSAGSMLEPQLYRSIMGAARSVAGKNVHLGLFLRRQKAGPPPGCR
ncbi:hypothetical protein DFH06DRAFT_1153218 [Mycena polygramma]|nr:hypothetical protein DFH06DRAFT_1153218 [Mycena polygramma]